GDEVAGLFVPAGGVVPLPQGGLQAGRIPDPVREPPGRHEQGERQGSPAVDRHDLLHRPAELLRPRTRPEETAGTKPPHPPPRLRLVGDPPRSAAPKYGGEVYTLPLRVPIRERRGNTSPPYLGERSDPNNVRGRVRGCFPHGERGKANSP